MEPILLPRGNAPSMALQIHSAVGPRARTRPQRCRVATAGLGDQVTIFEPDAQAAVALSFFCGV